MKKKYITQLGTSYLQIAVSILIPFLLTPYMIRSLGTELYGLWVLLNSIIIYFGLASFGFGTTLLTEISQTENLTMINKHITTIFVFFMLIILAVSFIFLIIMYYFDSFFIVGDAIVPIAKTTFAIMFLLFIVNFVTSIFHIVLFAKGLLYIQNMINIIQAIMTAVFMFGVLYYGYTVVALAIVNLIVSSLMFVYVVHITKTKIKIIIRKHYFDSAILKKMLVPSMHYFLITSTAMIILYSDNIILSSLAGLSSVAVYSIGYKLIDMSQQILFKIVDVVIPDIAKLYGNREYTKILKLHNKLLFYSLSLAVPGYAILFYWGLDMITLWVGESFTIDQSIFNVFILFGLWHTWVHVSAIFIVAMGIHKETSYMGIVDAVLNILISIILFQYYGVYGVAMGTLLAHILTNGWFSSYWFYHNIKLLIKEQEKDGVFT